MGTRYKYITDKFIISYRYMYQEAPRGTSNVTATFIIIIFFFFFFFFFGGGLGCVYVERGGGEGWRNKKL